MRHQEILEILGQGGAELALGLGNVRPANLAFVEAEVRSVREGERHVQYLKERGCVAGYSFSGDAQRIASDTEKSKNRDRGE
jgi:hypothetical protein